MTQRPDIQKLLLAISPLNESLKLDPRKSIIWLALTLGLSACSGQTINQYWKTMKNGWDQLTNYSNPKVENVIKYNDAFGTPGVIAWKKYLQTNFKNVSGYSQSEQVDFESLYVDNNRPLTFDYDYFILRFKDNKGKVINFVINLKTPLTEEQYKNFSGDTNQARVNISKYLENMASKPSQSTTQIYYRFIPTYPPAK